MPNPGSSALVLLTSGAGKFSAVVRPVHCMMLNSIFSFYPTDTSGAHWWSLTGPNRNVSKPGQACPGWGSKWPQSWRRWLTSGLTKVCPEVRAKTFTFYKVLVDEFLKNCKKLLKLYCTLKKLYFGSIEISIMVSILFIFQTYNDWISWRTIT